MTVAPFTGAWIETVDSVDTCYRAVVAPFTGAWIETDFLPAHIIQPGFVAPFTGAWIETRLKGCTRRRITVAPFTGAWIETLTLLTRQLNILRIN